MTGAHPLRLRLGSCTARIMAGLALAMTAWHAVPREAHAIPAFARREKMPCHRCHDSWPRLNKFGFMFRAMGYRTPQEINGEEGPGLKRLLDAFAMKGGLSFNVTRSSRCVDKEVFVESVDVPGHTHGGSTGITIFCNKEDAVPAAEVNIGSIPLGVAPIRREKSPRRDAETAGVLGTDSSKTRIGFSAPEVDIFSSAPFGRYYSTFFDVRLAADSGKADVHMGNVRATFGQEDRFFQVKAGIMHPVEGWAGLDNSVTFTEPLVTATPAAGKTFSFAYPSQIGVMLGGGREDTLASITVFNGLASDGSGTAGFSRDNNRVDAAFNLVQFVGDTGGAVEIVGYLGSVDEPKDASDPDSETFRNGFWRGAIVANYPPIDALHLLAGIGGGRDMVESGGERVPINSKGFFGEVDIALWDNFTPLVRYDFFDPSDARGGGTRAVTVGFASPWEFQRWVAEYHYMRSSGSDAVEAHAARIGWEFAF